MKKKSTKTTKPKTKRTENREISELNSQLGSFGLEPPKRYRSDQRLSSDANRAQKTPQKKKKAPQNTSSKTPQQRRQEQDKKRKKNKLVRKIVFYITLSVSIVAVIIVLSLTVLFKITDINITGNSIYTVEEIRAVLPIKENDNLFISDTKGASNKLKETLPYIYDAKIRRKIPSTINIEITETPVIYAIVNEDESYTLVDDTYKVLETGASEKPDGAIVIQNAPITAAVVGSTVEFGDEKIAENLKTLSEAVSRLKLDKITAIYSNDINNNFMVYENRITFKLGTLENLDDKIYSALSATEKLNESNPEVKGTMTVTDDKQIYFTDE